MQDERPSKTQRKKEVHALQALGERLVGLNAEQLAAVPLPDDLRDAVLEAKRIRSREGHRRQLQYIAHHRIERWRLRLLDDDGALTEFAREHPRADLQRLRTCVREARKERLAGGEPRHFRDLFRLIREAEAGNGAKPPL